MTEEYLLVELMNNLENLAEDTQALKGRVTEKSKHLRKSTLQNAARKFGTVRTCKFFDAVTTHPASHGS